jgi:CDP-diacylglycerol--glycerol-3-phosphate 3-phosphatidyltransferase
MASIYDLKPRFQQLLMKPTGALYRAGATANQVTLFAALASLVCGLGLAWLIAREAAGGAAVGLWWLVLPVFLFVRMALNAIDGMLARQFNQKSALGALLNEAGDVLADAALYLPFALLPGVWGGWVVILVVLSAVSELVGVLCQTIGGSRRYDGPLGKSDRAFVFGVLALLLGLGVPYLSWFWIVVALANLELVWTIWNRGRRGLREAAANAAASNAAASTAAAPTAAAPTAAAPAADGVAATGAAQATKDTHHE